MTVSITYIAKQHLKIYMPVLLGIKTNLKFSAKNRMNFKTEVHSSARNTFLALLPEPNPT